jgi:multidrug efflux pump subunit AcrB
MILARRFVSLLVYGVLIGGMVFLFRTIPGGFVPEEDKGTIYVVVDAPSGASAERTREALKKAEAILAAEPTVQESIAILGFSIFYRYANQAFVFATLKPWDERHGADEHVSGVLARLNRKRACSRSTSRRSRAWARWRASTTGCCRSTATAPSSTRRSPRWWPQPSRIR